MKFALVAKVFCGHAYSTYLIRHMERVNREKKNRADWTNRHILEQMNRVEKIQNCHCPV